MKRVPAQYKWGLGLAAFLIFLLVAMKIVQPDCGSAGHDSLARSALPYAFATVGMAIVLLAGGIDLSVAAMMAVVGVASVVLMVGAGCHWPWRGKNVRCLCCNDGC